MTVLRFAILFSGVAFLIYGVFCIFSTSMVSDFHRFGMDGMRVPTGVLEVLGGAGLLVGLRWTPALLISSAGIALLMLIAFSIRMRMHDSVVASSPSLLLTLLNLWIFIRALKG